MTDNQPTAPKVVQDTTDIASWDAIESSDDNLTLEEVDRSTNKAIQKSDNRDIDFRNIDWLDDDEKVENELDFSNVNPDDFGDDAEDEDDTEDDEQETEEDLSDEDDTEEDPEEDSDDDEEDDEEEIELTAQDFFELEFEMKINGEQKTIDGKRLFQYAQQVASAEEKLNQAKAEKQQVNDVLKMLASKEPDDVFGILESLGHNVRDLINSHVNKQIKINKMTPEQKRLYAQQQKLLQEQREFARQEQEKKQKAIQKQKAARLQQLGNDISTKLAESKLEAPMVRRAVIHEIETQIRYGIDVDVDTAIANVRDQLETMSRSALKELPDEVLDELVGEKERKAMRSRRKKVRTKEATKDLPTRSKGGKKRVRASSHEKNLALWKEFKSL